MNSDVPTRCRLAPCTSTSNRHILADVRYADYSLQASDGGGDWRCHMGNLGVLSVLRQYAWSALSGPFLCVSALVTVVSVAPIRRWPSSAPPIPSRAAALARGLCLSAFCVDGLSHVRGSCADGACGSTVDLSRLPPLRHRLKHDLKAPPRNPSKAARGMHPHYSSRPATRYHQSVMLKFHHLNGSRLIAFCGCSKRNRRALMMSSL